MKSDPAIIDDLPPKNEMNVVCTLTREQVRLYQAVVDEEMRRIESAEGIERRVRVLALLSFLKQVCNHPAQYLGEPGPLARRSGKLERVTEMLEEALEAGDKVLVFTQLREMGDRLGKHFEARLGVETLFLHGGTPKRKRDEMVRRFQELSQSRQGPPVFVLKARMAMAVTGKNRHYKWAGIQPRHWLTTAASVGLDASARADIHALTSQTSTVVDTIADTLPAEFPKHVADPILDGLLEAANRLAKL